MKKQALVHVPPFAGSHGYSTPIGPCPVRVGPCGVRVTENPQSLPRIFRQNVLDEDQVAFSSASGFNVLVGRLGRFHFAPELARSDHANDADELGRVFTTLPGWNILSTKDR